jgi:hypothetical protein
VASPSYEDRAVPEPDVALAHRERCHRELAHASVTVAAGTGAIDAVVPVCGPGRALTVYVVRGHTLSRVVRSREPGATFGAPRVISTGVDRLGPAAMDGAHVLLAWRSPTSALDNEETDTWWTANVDDDGDAARGTWQLPSGYVGLGTIAPVERDGNGVAAIATVAREGRNPFIVRSIVRPEPTTPHDAVDAGMPGALADGELEAYEPEHRVALALAVTDEGATELRALDFSDAAADRGRVHLAGEHALVAAHAVAATGARSLFAYSEFDPSDAARDASGAAPCIPVSPSLCVRAGAPTLLLVGPGGTRTVAVARSGLVDDVVLDSSERAIVLYVAPAADAGQAQRAARVDTSSGRVEPLVLQPADPLPPLDHPAVVRCDGEPWLAAEVMIADPDAGVRDDAVLAAPLSCLLATPAI